VPRRSITLASRSVKYAGGRAHNYLNKRIRVQVTTQALNSHTFTSTWV